ncbi:MAG TPA: ATP synthase F1 subunit epsilon [Bacteroidetes bacterium]|mgnify:CR=1 FL=1|nr:ATP synthase F1 subunit epsilon [Bacteroidota bacterium]
MKVEIISPVEKIYTGEIKLLQVPGSLGSFQVLKNHAPIVSTLREGVIRIIDQTDRESRFPVTGGVIEVKKNRIVVLVETVKS